MTSLKFVRTLAAIGFCAGASLHPSAFAEPAWPTARIDMIVPYPAGASTDILGRAFGEALSKQLGVPVVVQNKPGATGTIGSSYVARARPDGETLLFTAESPLTISPYLMKVPFDPIKDFAPIASVAISPVVIVARKSAPYDSFAQLVAYAKQHPGAVSVGFPGVGSVGYIGVAQIEKAADIKFNRVPYQGSNQAVIDAVAGNLDLLAVNADAVLAQVASGQLKALSLTSPKRLPAWPDVPTFSELGYAGVQFFSNWGVFYSSRVPPKITARLTEATRHALQDPILQKVIARYQSLPSGVIGDAFAAQIKSDYENNGKALRRPD